MPLEQNGLAYLVGHKYEVLPQDWPIEITHAGK